MYTLLQDLRYGTRISLRHLGLNLFVVLALVFAGNAQDTQAQRLFQPEDLFRIWQVGTVAWSPNGRYAAIEIVRPGRTLDRTVPTGELRLLDVRTQKLSTLSSNASAYLGFFNPVWSPDGRR
ncbi:MAG TPA: hypothetical protein VEF04_08950, partial [Blastocatellia bacterium]|nr:hypothetical protein [Blastocatellia bacterium]